MYDSLMEYVVDGLRLSEGMGRKNALAGLWWGGGKGVIWRDPAHSVDDAEFRNNIYKDYGGFVTSLKGCYVTAEDAGTIPDDLKSVFKTTRFATCIPPNVGGSGNPGVPTSLGVACAMEGVLDHLNGDTLDGKVVSIQGSGNVAQNLCKVLLERGVAKIKTTDVQEESLQATADVLRDVPGAERVESRLVSIGDNSPLFDEEADIVSPCGMGGTLNRDTIPKIRAKIICGAANNQLLDDQADDKLIQQYQKIYVPDFLANRMGIVNCSNEQYGSMENDEAINRHFGRDWENSIFTKTKEILNLAEKETITSTEAAIKIADRLCEVPHPIWGHRSKKIINSLVAHRWHEQPSIVYD